MAEDIPVNSDLIIVGTGDFYQLNYAYTIDAETYDLFLINLQGLVESIVAAAASRIGKQVVHLDYRDCNINKYMLNSYLFNLVADGRLELPTLGYEPNMLPLH